MKLAGRVKPLSYFKAHAAEVMEDIIETGNPFVITQNGEAKAVLQDLHSYEETQNALALLKIIALGDRQVREGKTVSLDDAFGRVRRKQARR